MRIPEGSTIDAKVDAKKNYDGCWPWDQDRKRFSVSAPPRCHRSALAYLRPWIALFQASFVRSARSTFCQPPTDMCSFRTDRHSLEIDTASLVNSIEHTHERGISLRFLLFSLAYEREESSKHCLCKCRSADESVNCSLCCKYFARLKAGECLFGTLANFNMIGMSRTTRYNNAEGTTICFEISGWPRGDSIDCW